MSELMGKLREVARPTTLRTKILLVIASVILIVGSGGGGEVRRSRLSGDHHVLLRIEH